MLKCPTRIRCMGTMESIIAGHNRKIIRQEREKKEKEKECDCRVYEARYPLKRKGIEFLPQTLNFLILISLQPNVVDL